MKYKNIHDKYKIATVVLSIISVILLIACLLLLKFSLGLKDQLLLCAETMSEIETQVTQFQTGTVQMSEEYNKVVTELTNAATTIESQKKEIELLQDTIDTYKEQINTLMGAYGQRTQSSQNTQQTPTMPSSLSMPSLGINTNTSSALQQGAGTNNSTQSQNNSNFEVVTID